MKDNFREFKSNNQETGGVNNARKQWKMKSGKQGIGKTIGLIVLVLFIAISLFDSVYSIREQEQGVVTTFGKAGNVVTSGLHFKIPYIQKVTKVNTTILGFPIGYSNIDNSIPEEQALAESLMITSDFNFVNVDFYVEYKVSDPVKYLFNSQKPELILKNVSQACIRNIISNYTVDDVITTGKSEIQSAIKEMIIKKIDEYDIGITLVNISLQDAEPPTQEVIEAFKAVETAKQGKETAINNANKYMNETIPKAKAQADQIVQAAEAQKQERINEATGQVVRFNEMYTEYTKNPLITKQRMYYEAMEKVLPEAKIVIDSDGGNINKTMYIDELKINDVSNKDNTTTDNADNSQADNE